MMHGQQNKKKAVHERIQKIYNSQVGVASDSSSACYGVLAGKQLPTVRTTAVPTSSGYDSED
jgi:hypothetical protein